MFVKNKAEYMMMELYKEMIVHELEVAADENEVERIINRSVDQFPEKDLYRFLVIIYLHLLQNGLEKLSAEKTDSIKWRNIRHALDYLKEMNDNRARVE